MTKRDFFILLLKLFGLYHLIANLFSTLPSSLTYARMEMDFVSGLWIALTIIVVLGLFFLLIFKADKIADWLKLEKGFENDFIQIGQLNEQDILKTGIFIIGGLLLLNNVPDSISYTYQAFKFNVSTSPLDGVAFGSRDNNFWGVTGLNVLIGFLLMRNYDLLAGLLKRKTEMPEKENS